MEGCSCGSVGEEACVCVSGKGEGGLWGKKGRSLACMRSNACVLVGTDILELT